MDGTFVIMLIIAAVVIYAIWRRSQADSGTGAGTEAGTSAGSRATSGRRRQMVDDIRLTQTSSIADVISIVDELGSASKPYRHYAKFTGTTTGAGVTAPYSKRQVAYYDIRCYRIDYRGGQEVETLVAHEKSIDPFCFVDGSCDTPVYVNIDSFGSNVILTNSTNHVEGPGSAFAKAMGDKFSDSGTGYATTCMGHATSRLGNLLGGARRGLDHLLLPNGAPTFGLAAQGAVCAGCGQTPNVLLAGPGGPGGLPGGGGRPGGGPGGRMGGGPRPGGFGDGPMPRGYSRPAPPPQPRPRGGYYGTGRDLGSTVLDIGLGALLGSMAASTLNDSGSSTSSTSGSFRGYRLIEDIVPLNAPVFVVGEVYRLGAQYYIGASTSSQYTTSFFSTKTEAEVLTHLGA